MNTKMLNSNKTPSCENSSLCVIDGLHEAVGGGDFTAEEAFDDFLAEGGGDG